MDALAVEQAKGRLTKAEKALELLKSAPNYEEAESAWSDFLLAASTIYSKLEQGSKGHGKSQGWFGRKKKERRDDPLLRYLHFARNSDEHGIARVAAITPENTDIGGQRKLAFNERRYVKFQQIDEATHQPIGPQRDAVLAGPTLKPIRVYDDRFGDSCDPPKTHLGAEIQYSDFVDALGSAALPYLRQLVAEAESFVVSRSIAT